MSSSRSRPSILIIWILSLAAVEALSATKAEARAPGKFFSFHYTRQSIEKEREKGGLITESGCFWSLIIRARNLNAFSRPRPDS